MQDKAKAHLSGTSVDVHEAIPSTFLLFLKNKVIKSNSQEKGPFGFWRSRSMYHHIVT